MLEIIEKIKGSEAAAEDIKRKAVQDAAAARQNAHQEGDSLVRQAREEASRHAADIVSKAESEAEELLRAEKAGAEEACSQLNAKAQPKLEEAAQLIVERIVDGL